MTVAQLPQIKTLQDVELRIQKIHMQYHSMVDYETNQPCTPAQLKLMEELDNECRSLLAKKNYLQYQIQAASEPKAIKERSRFADQLDLMSTMQPFSKFHIQRVLRFTGSQAHCWISKGIEKGVLVTHSPKFAQNKFYVVIDDFETML